MMTNKKFLLRRSLAVFIDYTLILTLSYIYILYFGDVDSQGSYCLHGINVIPVFIFWFIYNCVTEVTLDSTFGNYLVGLKTVDHKSEQKINLKQSFLRYIVDPLDMSFFGIVAVIIITTSEESRRLGDLLAKTKVIKI